jgi:hypothetical protein
MRVIRLIWAAAAMMVAVAVQAQAGPVRVDGTTVIVNEVPVLQFKTAYNGLPPELRAANFVQRLSANTGAINVSGSGDVRKMFRGQTLLAVISPDDATQSGQSLESLASSWYASVRDALNLPALKLSQESVKIPVGENRTIKLVGSKAFAAVVTSSSYQVAKAIKTSDGLTITGSALGQATLSINAGSVTLPLNVDVLPYAASLPQTVSATVSGMPAAEDTVQGAIEAAIRTQVKTIPGAALTFRVDNPSSINIGDTNSIDVKVHIEAPKAFPENGIVHVNLRNLPLGKKPESALWYCNDPENLKKPGPLFSSQLLKDNPVRLLYHHDNDSESPLFVRIQLVNDSDSAARILILPGDAKPDKNPVLAGLLAADQFLRHWINNSGEVVYIGPRSSVPVSLRRVLPGETMSGLCDLRLLDGGPDSVLLRADAIAPFDADARWSAAMNSSTPWRFVGSAKMTYYDQGQTVTSSHIYPDPFKLEKVDYVVGGRYGFVRIGQKPISNTSQDDALEGNFGVIYTIQATMTNPSKEAADVEVIFEASAGYAGALFTVNGQVKRTLPLPPKATTQLAIVHLDPGATKTMTLQTIPHSGGSYPATLTIRPIQDEGRFQANVGHH